ncbi:nitroreductase [Mycolicibacterium duvalii]|uniref:Nitroreductase n=1 Tax=Mycolicibacterium duvalii TaxID=39688 RepID=A0A7I7K2Y0_9MYCO|nr:nitroreductase family deazaflavin-dependent oxidoreductase [Mycolicibacterium duvalii]MCV7367990.1 nitroreductase family deazaflavin-dependent oxidoreductase [Mycolicibacterium duvalii]PEG39012.1 nitroreductase [Mycolicibacterium duvalii]BBX18417.1 nitroreductase [Mycolicibacterium duvalii]
MSGSTLNGISRVDPRSGRPGWKRAILRAAATKPGTALHRMVAARLDKPLMKVTGGRVTLGAGAVPVAILTSIGARTGKCRETPVTYFTDGDDVILMASNYGGDHHPGWFYNLLANPECELHIGPRGGRFTARETHGVDRDQLFALAVELYSGYGRYAQRTEGVRTIRVLRLTPSG